MDAKKLDDLLDKIEESLGHYSPIGGIEPPYIKTDDEAIRESVGQIRAGMKSINKDVFVTNKGMSTNDGKSI